jgi:tetratricopeptide (TPR) repeat protein
MKGRSTIISLMLTLGVVGFRQPANAAPAPAFRPILQSVQNQLSEGMVMRLPAFLYVYGGPGMKQAAYASLAPYQSNTLRVKVTAQPNCQANACSRGYIAVFRSTSEDSHVQFLRSESRLILHRDPITLAKGVKGTYIFVDIKGGLSNRPYHVVLWEQDGLTFVVSGVLPDKEGMIEIAKSMASEPPILSRLSTAAAQSPSPKFNRITWQQSIDDIARGGTGFSRYIKSDYDLPQEFRNGYVYAYNGASVITAYILKSGLSSYPPVQEGPAQIDWKLAQDMVRTGKAISFYWSLGYSGNRYDGDPRIRFPKAGQGCLQRTCLTAPFMTNAQISSILRSQRAVGNVATNRSLSTHTAYIERADARSSNGDKQGAIADYTEAIRLNSSFASAYYNRAIDRVAVEDKQGAISDFKKAAELFGNQGRGGDQQDALSEISKLGGERSLIIAANSPSISGETIEPGSKWEVKNLIYNPTTSIVVDRYSCRRLKNGSEICSFDVYNLNHANAVLEVYDRQGQLLELRGADAIRNPTSVIGFPVESIEKLYKLSTEGFGLNDPRNTVGSAKTEIRNLVIPNGGHFKITKSGENALRYNQATFAMDLLLDSGLPTVFGSNSSLKVRLLSAIFFKLQQKRVGSLVKDGAFITSADTAKAFVNGRWIEEENLAALTEIAFKALEEELPQYALDRAVGDQARKEAERLIAKRLTVWIDIAETFAKGGNVFLQWLDWERSRKAAQNALIFPVVK